MAKHRRLIIHGIYDDPAGGWGADPAQAAPDRLKLTTESNCLAPLHQDQKSGTPSYKSVPIRVAKSA